MTDTLLDSYCIAIDISKEKAWKVLLGHFSYFYMEHYIFDFDAILVLPYVYHFYPFIFLFMCTLDIVLLFVTSKKMKERDYIIKQNEICE